MRFTLHVLTYAFLTCMFPLVPNTTYSSTIDSTTTYCAIHSLSMAVSFKTNLSNTFYLPPTYVAR